MNTHCHNRHPLMPGISSPQSESPVRHCDVCLVFLSSAESQSGVLSCTACNVDVCGACVRQAGSGMGSGAVIDTGALLQLRRHKAWPESKVKTLYDVYREQPRFAQELFREIDAAGVFWTVQKFEMTDQYRTSVLKQAIESAKEESIIAQAKVLKAENTLKEFDHERVRFHPDKWLVVEEEGAKRKRDPEVGAEGDYQENQM